MQSMAHPNGPERGDCLVSGLAHAHTHCFPQLCDSACLSNRWCLCVCVYMCVSSMSHHCRESAASLSLSLSLSFSLFHTHRHYTIIDAPFANSNITEVFYRLTFNEVLWRQATMCHCSELWLENPTHEPKYNRMQQLPLLAVWIY